MAETVRICKDLTGWFATMGDDAPGYPGVRVHWEQTYLSREDALRVLDLAHALVSGLRGDRLLFWRPELESSSASGDRLEPTRQVLAPGQHRQARPRRRRSILLA